MNHYSRREILSAGAAGAGLLTAPWSGRAAAGPALSIAHYRSSPTAPDGVAEEARRLVQASVSVLGGMGRFVNRGDVVWIKPNIGWNRRPEQAATTNPDVVAALVSLSYQAGAKRVVVYDNSCNPAPASYARSGIQAAAQKAGADCFVPDMRKFRPTNLNGKTLKDWPMYADAIGVTKVINVAIVKHHGLCKATLGMKNLMGIAGGDRNRFHQDLSGSVADLAAFVRPTLVVLDAIRVLTANGPVGGNLADVQRRDTLIAGVDQVAVDSAGASLLGLKPQDVGYIVEASRRGVGTTAYESLGPKRIEL